MDKTLRDLIEIIHFMENVSAKIHGLPDEAAIYRTMMEEFAQSERYTASILLLRDDGSKLGIAETSIAPEKLQAGEETAGVRLKGYGIDLDKSSIYRQVVREGKTLQVNVSDIMGELSPRPVAYLISKTMGYEEKPCILTPLRRQGKIIGALAVSSPVLADYFVPSVRNLAQHISTALELAHEHVERRQADEELREYRDRLEELVEERTAELKQSNEQLHREITERKRAEEALKESESRLSGILSSMVDLVFAFDDEGRFIFHHAPRIEDLYVPPDEFIGKKPLEVMPAHLNDLFFEAFEESRKGEVAEFEYWLEIGGRVRWFFAKMSPVLLEGEFTGSVAVVREITERRQVEEALRKNEERYRSLFNGVPVGINLTTPEGQILDANPALVEMLGYPNREALLAVNATDLYVDPADRRQWQALIQREGVVHGFEVQLRRCDGTTMLVRSNARAVCDANGRVVCYEGSLEDITERKRAEEALRESEEKFRSLVSTAPDGIVLTDAQGTIVELNEAYAQLYGYERDEMLGESFLEFIPRSESRARAEQMFQVLQETGSILHQEVPILTKTGAQVPVELAVATLRNDSGQLTGLVAIIRDITERRQVEEALRQRTAQLEALRQVDLEIAAEFDLDSLLHSIVSQAVELVRGAAGGLYLYRPDLDKLMWVTSIGPNMAPAGTILHRGEGLSGKVWETGKSLIVDDCQHWESRAAIYEGYPWTAVVGVPVYWREKFLGVLNVLTDAPRTFSPADAELLTLLATQAAIAIRNVCLFEGELEQRELAGSLGEAAAVITSTLDLDQVLDRILEQVSRVVPNDATNIMFIEGDRARVVRCRGYERFGAEDFISTVVCHIPDVPGFQQMVRSRKPLAIPDTANCPDQVRIPVADWLRSYAAAPIVVRGEVIGFLNVDSATSGFFTQADAEALRAFADHAAAAIENARLYTEARRRLQEQTALREAGAFISSTLDAQTVLSRIAEQMCRAVDATSAYISGYDPMTNTSSVLAEHIGPRACPREQVSDLGITYVEDAGDEWLEVMKSGQYDISHVDAPDLIESEQAHMQQFGVQTILYIPLRTKGQLIGYAEIWESRQRREFTPEEIALCQGIAQQAAIALENARLYEQAHQEVAERKRTEKALKRRAAQLATVNKIGQQIASILDLGELLRQIVDLLEEAFSYRYVYILLLDEDSNELVARAGAGAGRVLEGTRIPVEARSINARVARTGEPFLANDVSKEPLYLLLEEIADTKSELCVPIRIKDQVIGTLDVQSTKSNAFDESDLFTLQALAGQAGIAIENARLYEESRHRLSELSTIHEISMAATSTMDFNQALERAAAAMQRILNFQAFGFLLLDESTGELHFHPSYRGIDPEMADKLDLRLGKGITGWVAETGQPLLVPDVSQDPRYFDAVADTRSEMCVPLKIGERVIGVINVESDQVNAFSEDDLRLLSTLAGQVATTIENARLFAETEGKANDLALLLDTSTAISSTLDLDQILETVAHQITTSLMATFCRISLLDDTGENLVIRAVSPVRGWKAEGGFRQPHPLTMVPWHKQVIETAEPVILRQDVPELALSDEELKAALTDGVKSAVLIPLIVGGRVLGVIAIGEERGWERSPFTREKVELCQSIAFQAAVAIENAYLYEELQQSFLQTIAALAAAVDAKDRYTGGHSQRTTKLAATIAEELGLSEEDIELTRYASLLHDVGKIGISERILSKPGPLDEKEWSQIHRHPALGADIVERAASLQKLGPIILYHHERYDGQGYPAGLSGEDIPLKARILAVADAYEAMTSERTYRPAMTVEQALATLRDGADKQWDGEVVEVLIRIIREQGEQGYHSEPDQPPNVSVGPYDVLVWRKGLSESL